MKKMLFDPFAASSSRTRVKEVIFLNSLLHVEAEILSILLWNINKHYLCLSSCLLTEGSRWMCKYDILIPEAPFVFLHQLKWVFEVNSVLYY